MGEIPAMNLTGKGPMGLKKPKPERGTKAAKEHLQRVKMLPCVICRKPGPSDAHHVICERFSSNKAGDFETIPLCKNCHQEGPNAIHNGKRSWVERNGPDYEYLDTVREWLKAL
jgi:hypothetical protein